MQNLTIGFAEHRCEYRFSRIPKRLPLIAFSRHGCSFSSTQNGIATTLGSGSNRGKQIPEVRGGSLPGIPDMVVPCDLTRSIDDALSISRRGDIGFTGLFIPP